MPDKKDVAVIQLRTVTRERLKSIGKKGESYDAIINRIMDERKAYPIPPAP